MSSPLFSIPPLDYFTSQNPYTGSLQNFNYKITPGEALEAVVWYGPLCSEKSEMAAQNSFPLSDEGCAQLLQWLAEEFSRCPKPPAV